MEGFDGQLRKILEGYASFLREKGLALPKHQPCLVHWVRGTRGRVVLVSWYVSFRLGT